VPDLIEPATPRLQLRQWRSSDRAPFAELNRDPRVMEFFPSPLTREQSDAMADRCEALIRERGWGFWAIELKASRSFIGFVGLHIPAAQLPFSPCTEVGWRLAFEHWGHGYATEAARAALHVGFELLALEEIVSFTTVANLRSRAVMERLGMKESGFFEHPGVPVGSPLRNHCLYRVRNARKSERAEVESLEVVVRLWIHPGRVAEFEAYEHKAAHIMQRYGGAVQKVVRASTVDVWPDGQPFEVHVLGFPSLEAFHSYRADPELAGLAAERSAAISRTEVSLGDARCGAD
jgi:RimJ/RimL family protein N-acetyltransferase/uncharacterized protein (DUF1330 family)